jgi:hypothetical protein
MITYPSTFFSCAMLALSALQDGPLPNFLSEGQLDVLVQGENWTPQERQFADGMNVLGLLEVIFDGCRQLTILKNDA